ncbi:MAG TPA: LPS export ABC transporter permease LptG [Pseudomonas sp.]|nr:LPS export ABC transporter permease LptG [Pseudomonas sp.]
MGMLDRYIGRNVLFSILAVLGVILGLALLFDFIDELGDMSGDYGVPQAVRFVLLSIPQRTYEMLPMAALIGCLIGLGTLASSSELTVMRAAGVSLARMVWAVMRPMLVLMAVGLLIGQYLAPWTEGIAQTGRSLAHASGGAQTTRHGLWHRQGDEFIHINSVQPGGMLFGVTRYRFDDQRRMLTASFARNARYEDGHWVLEEVSTTRLLDDHSEVVKTPSERWEIELTPQLISVVAASPESLSISGLWDYIHYLGDQGLNNNRYWLAFWTKVLQPLVTAALVLLAISFIFGPLRSVTLGQRIFTGVVVGFSFRIAQDMLGPASLVFGFSPLLAVLVPACACSAIGVWLLRRAG